MSLRTRRCAQLAGLVLLGLGVAVGWASAAEARPRPDPQCEGGRCVPCPEKDDRERGEGCVEVEIECDDRNVLEQAVDVALPGGGSEPIKLIVPQPLDGNADNDGPNEWDWYVDQAEAEARDDNCELANHAPDNDCVRGQGAPEGGLEFPLPENCWGPYPTSHYTISYNGGDWNDFDDKLFGAITKFLFSIGRATIQVGLWLIGSAFSFDLEKYTSFSNGLAHNYQERLIERPLTDSSSWNLEDLVWFVLISFAGITALRGKIGVAGGEIALSIVVAALALVLMQNRAGFMNTTADLIDDTSSALLMAGTGHNPSAANRDSTIREAVRHLQEGIHYEFVATPYDWVNWGGPNNLASGDCQAARNRVLQVGRSDDGGWARRYMRAEGCRAAAEYNDDPTDDRMLSATITSAVGIWVSLVLGLTALTVIISKFTVALLFAIVPFAAVAAALPGTGRRLAWMWLATLFQAVFAVAGTSIVLTFLMLGVQQTRRIADRDDNPLNRWLIVLLIVAVVYMARRRLLGASQQAATAMSDTLTRLSPASNWAGGPPTGMNLEGMDKAVSSKVGAASQLGAWGAGAAVGATALGAARTIPKRMTERRVARRAMRNLELMERRRERPQYEFKATPRPMADGGRSLRATQARMGRGHGQSSRPGGRSADHARGHGGGGSSRTHAGGASGAGTPVHRPAGHVPGEDPELTTIKDLLGEGGGPQLHGSPGYDVEAQITGKIRSPRSWRPRPGDVLHPTRAVKRPFHAAGDHWRLHKFKKRLGKMTTSSQRSFGIPGTRLRFNRRNRQDNWRKLPFR